MPTRHWMLGSLLALAAIGCAEPVDTDEARLAAELASAQTRVTELESQLAAAKQDAEFARARAQGLAIGLPKARSGDAPTDSTIFMFVGAHGWTLDGAAIEADALDERLRKLVQTNPETSLVIAAGPDVPFDSVVALLDVAKSAGMERVSMAPPIPAPIEARDPP